MLIEAKRPAPIIHEFADDGRIPNNPTFPLVLYRGGVNLVGSPDPKTIVETFCASGRGDMGRNGILSVPALSFHDSQGDGGGSRPRENALRAARTAEKSKSRPAMSSCCRQVPASNASLIRMILL